VYFAQCRPAEGFLGPIKISSTKNLLTHLQALVSNNPFPVYLIGWITVDEPEKLEKQIHQQFSAQRVKGDWFQASDELITFIRQRATRPLPLPLAAPVIDVGGTLTIEQIAELLKVSVPTVRRLVASNAIPYHRFGRQIRFVRDEVLKAVRVGG
jgi:excisionase family DNA binding protein